jgi:hypothetical protein
MKYFDINHLPAMLFAEKELIKQVAKEISLPSRSVT